ncbi:MAG: 50S ribosomal protein L25 [Ignavibacteriales bacterium]|nr:50S ribosomal protein L25 [Ignavibacteriales bacterium]
MSEITIAAEIRQELGKRAKSLRRSGKVPGIYYGHGQQNIPVTMAELSLQPLYKTTATHVINLKLDDGSSHTCILRDVQFDPVTERPLHFDLFGLNEKEELTIEIPVRVKGTPKGVKDGGILQHVMHRMKVSCLPKNIPDHIEIDVTNLEINRSIHVNEVSVPNVKILESEKGTVVAVVPPTIEKAPEVVAAEAAVAPTEPEVIARGKKPEEGEEGAEKAPEKAGAEKAPAEKKAAPEKKPPAEKKAEKK